MSYTKKNLKQIEDMAPQFGFDAVQEARFAHDELGAEDTGVALMTVKPGCRQAFAHRHEEAEEIYVIISGTGRLKIDDEIVDVKPLDAIRMEPSAARQAEADGEGLEILAFGPRHDRDGEIIKEGIFD